MKLLVVFYSTKIFLIKVNHSVNLIGSKYIDILFDIDRNSIALSVEIIPD